MTAVPYWVRFDYDRDRPCPKCSHHPATTRHATWHRLHEGWEALRRTCPNCGYVWDEACVDAERAA